LIGPSIASIPRSESHSLLAVSNNRLAAAWSLMRQKSQCLRWAVRLYHSFAVFTLIKAAIRPMHDPFSSLEHANGYNRHAEKLDFFSVKEPALMSLSKGRYPIREYLVNGQSGKD